MRTPYDGFGKGLFCDTSAPTSVQTEVEVFSEKRCIDVWVMSESAQAAVDDELGLFGRIKRAPCTVELCHRTPGGEDVTRAATSARSCRCATLRRRSRRCG